MDNNPVQTTLTCHSLNELPAIASQLVKFAKSTKVWLFVGNLGAGKTTLIKEICTFMGVKDEVSSPSFAIVNEYATPNGHVYHIDGYRLKNVQEAIDIGMMEYFDSGSFCFVEWPQVVEPILPEQLLLIRINTLENEQRTYNLVRYE